MAGWDKNTLWSFIILLTGAVGQSVDYPGSICAVKGSTVTVLCTFTPLQSVTVEGEEVLIEIIRVVWCPNHLICHGTTPSVYDSESQNNDPRYRYLGDKKRNCTLQITDLQDADKATLRFRAEANVEKQSFTGKSGVILRVTESTPLKIDSSTGDRQVRGGETVTLSCSSLCTIHQLKVTWFKDGHALPESGPALRLRSLTAKDSGNYTCGLKTSSSSRSEPYSLHVEDEGNGGQGGGSTSLIAAVVFGVLLVLLVPIVVVCIIRRRRAAADPGSVGGKAQQKPPDNIYSNVLQQEEGGHRQETGSPAVEDVSYASVQFKHKNQARAVENEQDATIYSSVVTRG